MIPKETTNTEILREMAARMSDAKKLYGVRSPQVAHAVIKSVCASYKTTPVSLITGKKFGAKDHAEARSACILAMLGCDLSMSAISLSLHIDRPSTASNMLRRARQLHDDSATFQKAVTAATAAGRKAAQA